MNSPATTTVPRMHVASPGLALLEAATIGRGATLREALRALDAGGLEICFVEGYDGRLDGVITDGDIRRALLRGSDLSDGIDSTVVTDFVWVPPTADRASVVDLMQARGISQIPVIEAGRLVALHQLRSIVAGRERPEHAVIMAGGRGSRLGPLTSDVPKPMLRVAGRPILERLILLLIEHGVRTVHLSVNYLAEVIEAHFGDGTSLGCRIEYLREMPEVPLGTAGALSLLPESALDSGANLLVLNGDLVTRFDVGSILDAHADAGNDLTIGVHVHRHTVPFGVIEVEDDRVVRIAEKPTASWLVNAGVYAVTPATVRRLPFGRPATMVSLTEELLAEGKAIGAHTLDGEWIDIGEVRSLLSARGFGAGGEP